MPDDIVRIFVCGAHSTGKTTLVKNIVEKVNVRTECEVARDVIRALKLEEEARLPKEYPVEFERISGCILERQCLIQKKNEEMLQDYIMDRGIDPIIYAEMYLGKEAKTRLLQLEATKDCIARYKKSIIIVLKPHPECINEDGFRITPILDDLYAFTEMMLQTLQELKIDYVYIEELDRQARLNAVIKLIKVFNPRLIKTI